MWTQVVKDNAKAFVPFKPYLRAVLRRAVPYTSNPANDELAFDQGLEIATSVGIDNLKNARILEVGTGWIPTIPTLLKACGAGQIVMTDVDPLLDGRTRDHARQLVVSRLERISRATGIAAASLDAALRRDGVDSYRCPPATHALADGSFDLIYSRAVLEHIPPATLQSLFAEWHRLLRPGGQLVHIIDNTDHFEHKDKRLSRINFLRYPAWLWRIVCLNAQNYQNRLRHSDYRAMLVDNGFAIRREDGEPDPQAMKDARTMRLASAFARYDTRDLAILTSIFVARKP